MEESRNNGMMKSLKYVFVLVGVVAIVLAYFLVFNGYSDKADELDSEIDDLKSQYTALQQKAAKYNKNDVETYVAECDKVYNTVMREFDGGISYQSQIMDTYKMTQDLDIQIPSLSMSAVTDVAGAATTDVADAEREDIVFLTGQGYVEKLMTYQISTVVTYDKMKDVLEYILQYEGKRKVPTAVTFSYDNVEQEVTMMFSISEYAIAGEDRKVSDVVVPGYAQGSTNIFYNSEVVSRVDTQ